MDLFDIGLNLFAGSAAGDAADRQADSVMASAAENAKISRYDASVARKDAKAIYKNTLSRYELHARNVKKLIGHQKVKYAKSGVVTSEGSPVDVMMNTALRGYQDGQILLNNGKTAIERKKSEAKRYEMLADAGLIGAAAQASNIRSAGSDAQLGYTLKAVGSLFDDDGGWF